MRPTAGGQTERAAIRPAIARLISCRRWDVLILRTSTRRTKQSDILIVKTLRSTTTLYHFRRTCGLRPECLIRSPLSITSATFSYSIKICAEYRWERTVVVVVVVRSIGRSARGNHLTGGLNGPPRKRRPLSDGWSRRRAEAPRNNRRSTATGAQDSTGANRHLLRAVDKPRPTRRVPYKGRRRGTSIDTTALERSIIHAQQQIIGDTRRCGQFNDESEREREREHGRRSRHGGI